MDDRIWDVVVVGGGPAGLMCGLTAVSGLPIDPPGAISCLVLDKGRIGQFARYGKLRLTHRWHLMGAELVERLAVEAGSAGLVIREGERVIRLRVDGEHRTVETERGTYTARTAAVCPGFFPHGDLMEHGDAVRPVFSPAGLEARVIRAGRGERVALLGNGPSTVAFGLELATLRPDLTLSVAVEDPDTNLAPLVARGVDAAAGSFRVVRTTRVGLLLERMGGAAFDARLLLIDYNAYTTRTDSTAFLDGSGVERRSGYVVVDGLGRTSVAGVVAAGNIVTPVSGVLTALSTAFTAGLTLHRWLTLARSGREPDLFPWLPREGWSAHPLVEGGR